MNPELENMTVADHAQHQPLVSIGMPVYNGGKYIRDALESLLAQTFTDFELIISDNASADETESICREYAARDSRIRYIRQPANRGALKNFQFVLEEAVGEYFMWAAADDLWEKEYLEINLRFLKEKEVHIGAITGVRIGDTDLQNFVLNGCEPIDDACVRRRINRFFQCPGANARFYGVYRAAIIKKHNLKQLDFFGGDWAFVAFLLMDGPIGLSDSRIMFYKRPIGISNNVLAIFSLYSKQPAHSVAPLFCLARSLWAKGLISIPIIISLIKHNYRFVRAYWLAKALKYLDKNKR